MERVIELEQSSKPRIFLFLRISSTLTSNARTKASTPRLHMFRGNRNVGE